MAFLFQKTADGPAIGLTFIRAIVSNESAFSTRTCTTARTREVLTSRGTLGSMVFSQYGSMFAMLRATMSANSLSLSNGKIISKPFGSDCSAYRMSTTLSDSTRSSITALTK